MSDRLRPECPACCRPLRGQLVASRCNHVFHRECLPKAECPKCGLPDAGKDPFDKEIVADSDEEANLKKALQSAKACNEGPLELFGLNFGEGSGAISGTAPNLPPDEHRQRSQAVMEICTLRDKNDASKDRLAQIRQRVQQEKERVKRNEEKRAAAEKIASAFKQERASRAAELERHRQKYKDLCEEAQRHRERTTVMEYRRVLQEGSSEQALGFLTKMVTMAVDPAPMLTEVARLRDHYRTKMAANQKEGMAATQKAQRLERELRQREQSLEEVKRKLQRSKSSSSLLSASQSTTASGGSSPRSEPLSQRSLKRQRT